MKAVAYIRVSTEDQSLERQYSDIKEFAESKNLDLIKIFEDKISGSKTKTDERNGFNQMEQFIDKNQNIKHFLVLEISRLGRKNYDIQTVVERYVEKGINIHIKDLGQSTLDENGERNFASDLIILLLGKMAENETRLLGERISSGIMSKARQNLVFGGKIIGYKKGEDGTPVIDEEQAPMIKRIFELASEDLGMRNISAVIETEFDRKIAIGTLSGIIRNTFHKGERKYKDLTLQVPQIVTQQVWQKANDSIDSRSKFGSRKYVHPNIVQGKIDCGVCGNVMHQKVIPDGRLDLFVCKDEKCKNSINRPWLFRMIRLAVERHAQKTKDAQVRKKFKLQITSFKAELELNAQQLERLNKRGRRIRKMYLDEESTQAEYDEDKLELKKEIDEVISKNIKLNENIKITEKALNNDIEHFSIELAVFKKEIEDIIKHVTINKDNVLINIFGWRVYELYKPNSRKLGWEARKPKEERYKNETLPLRHPIDDENIGMMLDNELNDNSALIDKYLSSKR